MQPHFQLNKCHRGWSCPSPFVFFLYTLFLCFLLYPLFLCFLYPLFLCFLSLNIVSLFSFFIHCLFSLFIHCFLLCTYFPKSCLVWLKIQQYARKLKDIKHDHFPELECFGENWELIGKPNEEDIAEIWVSFLTVSYFRLIVTFQNWLHKQLHQL